MAYMNLLKIKTIFYAYCILNIFLIILLITVIIGVHFIAICTNIVLKFLKSWTYSIHLDYKL